MKVFGLLPYTDETELTGPVPTSFDPGFMRGLAACFDQWGYERVLIAQSAASPDSMVVASHVLAWTARLKVMIAHRPGFIAPTMAARMLATLDQLSGGRAGVHIITATNDAETQGDGDFLTKDERYRRSREYVEVLRRTWTEGGPFDHDGKVYRTRGSRSLIHPVRGSIPVFWGGASGLGVQFGGECADCYALAGGTRATVARLIAEVRAAAEAAGRPMPRVLMSIRVVIAEDDAAAWARAGAMADAVRVKAGARIGLGSGSDASAARRVAEAAAARTAENPCLWGGIIEATGGTSHAMALVGGPHELVAALRAYEALGVDDVLLRGFENLADAEAVGRWLIPALA